MKILFVVGTFPALSGTFVLNQITRLIDRGHEISILAQVKGIFEHTDIERYSLKDHALYPRCANSLNNPLKRLANLLKSLFWKPRLFLYLPSLFNKKTRDEFWLTLLDWQALSEFEYDVVICHHGQNGRRVERMKRYQLLRGQVVTFFHGSDVSTLLTRFGNSWYEKLFASGELFLPISNFWRQRLISIGAPKDKVHTFRMGVDCSQFRTRTAPFVEQQNVEIVSVARLVPIKGLEYGIRAVAKLVKATDFKIRYRIVGSGPLFKKLTNLISELKVDQHIHLLGAKTQQEVSQILSSSHVLLAPSISTPEGGIEGIPVSCMEAMASGVFVVSTDYGNIPELVKHEATGFLAPERDVSAIFSILQNLIEEPERYSHILTAARHHVEKQFNINVLVPQLEKLVMSIVQQ